MDRVALENLAKASKGPLDKPREMNHVLFNFSSKNDVDEAAAQIEHAGWTCTVFPEENEPNKFTLECQKMDYVINEANYMDDSAFFHRMADLYGAKYDGWYVSS